MEEKTKESLLEKLSTATVGVFFLIIGAVLIVLNFTVLPVFGIIFGVVLVIFGAIFFAKAQKKMSASG